MKQVFTFIFFSVFLQQLSAQTTAVESDTIQPPMAAFVQYLYNAQTKTTNFSYNYSGHWDFDGDGKTDSLYFIGNGGAHTYYYLRCIFSSEKQTRDYSTVQLDMPYASTTGVPTQAGNAAVQLVIHDFDNNGTPDLYINFNNDFSHIPTQWRKAGVTKKQVVICFVSKKFIVKGY